MTIHIKNNPPWGEATEQSKYIDNAPASPAERQQAGKITWDSFWIKGIAPSEINEIPFEFNMNSDIDVQDLLKIFNVKIDTSCYISIVEKIEFIEKL